MNEEQTITEEERIARVRYKYSIVVQKNFTYKSCLCGLYGVCWQAERQVLIMAIKAMNLKMDESRIADIKAVAGVFHMTITDLINDALDDYLPKMKSNPFYRLTANVMDASAEETEEILAEIESLSDDDLTIASTRHFSA